MWGMQFRSQVQKLGSHTQSDGAHVPQLERLHATATEAHALEPARCKYWAHTSQLEVALQSKIPWDEMKTMCATTGTGYSQINR